MTLDKIEKKIESYLKSDKRWSIIVDFANKSDLKKFLYHFEVGSNIKISAGDFCGKDKTFKFDELANCIDNNSKDIFITGISVYLKLEGESSIKRVLNSLLAKSVGGHIVIVTYQCRKYFNFKDDRYYDRGQIIISDGEFDLLPEICLISHELSSAFENAYIGFEKLGEVFETTLDKKIYIVTEVVKELFPVAILNIHQLSNGYEVLCIKDARIKNIPENYGDSEHWNALLNIMGSNDLEYVVEKNFGPNVDLISSAKQYPGYTDEKMWLYYVVMCVFERENNSYLSLALKNTENYKYFAKSLFRSILNVQKDYVKFPQLYEERKEILRFYEKYLAEDVEYCKVVSSKQEDSIYYLTDLSEPEREKIIEWLDMYGCKYTSKQLETILNVVYPDLGKYLSKYCYNNDLLDEYFYEYKYQKLVNRVLPEFKRTVEEQAIELGFVDALKSRSQLFDKIDLNNAVVYFFDALGVEYLSFIQAKCSEYGLVMKTICGRCELPSLTSFNKEFVDVCKEKKCPLYDIKELDDLKHHGENNFNYENIKIPIYLIRELEIIENLIKKIQAEIFAQSYEKAVIISDHGASRLAVLNDNENIWAMETKGEHSGRCCPKNEINEKPEFAIEESGYWILANYDRFKGSRKANYEVHGGATLEEVAVPIIEISIKKDNIEAFILDEYKTILLSPKQVPKMRVYVGIKSNDILMRVNDKYYTSKETAEKYVYEFELFECTKKGIYSADILDGSNVLSKNNKFEVTKKGLTEVSLFD